KNHEAKVEELRKKRVGLRYEGNVVAYLLKQQLEEEIERFKDDKAQARKVEDLKKEVAQLEAALKDYARVANKEELLKTYTGLKAPLLRAKLDDLLAQIREVDFESN